MLANKLMSSLSGGAEEKLYVDDVFSTYLYTGNGSTQTINNGIDLAGKGGLVWGKSRSSGVYSHALISNATGLTVGSSNLSNAFSAAGPISSFNSDGFTLGSASGINASGESEITWTFRKAPKFFDVVTYTGNGVDLRQISHSLNVAPRMVIIKRTDSTSDWQVYHYDGATSRYLKLNLTSASVSAPVGGYVWSVAASTFTLALNGNFSNVNASGATYVAYLFAHDSSADGIIQCGSFTTDSNSKAGAQLGWEHQYFLCKAVGKAEHWMAFDTMRGLSQTGAAQLTPSASDAESVITSAYGPIPSATGFEVNFQSYSPNQTYIYLAIRRPNKPPTTGTAVYNAIARTGTGAAATVTGVGFAPDLITVRQKTVDGQSPNFFDRLRGVNKVITSGGTSAESTHADSITAYNSDGVSVGADSALQQTNWASRPCINHFFKRAPGFMDVVCYTGTGNQLVKVNHNLTVRPELIIIKTRSAVGDWYVTVRVGPNQWKTWGTLPLSLNNASGGTAAAYTWDTDVNTSTYFSPYTTTNGNLDMSVLGTAYVAYLFATTPGVSKVGIYIGNGTTQTINCGFTTGARFILIKRTDSTGDWYIWDTARGIVSANDPHLSLNTTAAEVTTDDSVDPDASGFIVNQSTATNINVSGASYIFLSIA